MKISHIMSISRVLIDLCAIRQKIRTKNTFADISSEKEHKKVCLKINGKQSVN